MTATALGEGILLAFRRLEGVGEIFFKSKAAAEDALEMVKSSSPKVFLTNEGRFGQTTNELMRSLLSRVTTRATESGAFRIVMDLGDNNTVNIRHVMSDVRHGRVANLLDKLQVPAESAFRQPRFIEHLTRTLQKTYPDSVLENLSKRLHGIHEVPPELFDKSVHGSVNDLRSLIATDEQAVRLIKAIEASLKKGRPVVTKGLFFGFTLTAGGSAVIYAALSEAARRSVGCWRIFCDKETKELRSCRVRYATCSVRTEGDGGGMPYDRYCEHYPRVIKETSCEEEWSGKTPCVHCDPMGTGTDKLETVDYVDPTDIYICRSTPSLGEMLGQVVLDSPHVLSEAAGDVVKGAENIFSSVWNAAKSFGIFILVIGMVLLITALVFFRDKHVTDSEREALVADDDDIGHDEVDRRGYKRESEGRDGVGGVKKSSRRH